MFIDIVKFGEYAANLKPPEILRNLSLIFARFDESIPKHPLPVKTNLIGDVYISAWGLFNPETQPSAHVEQMIRSGLEAPEIVDDVEMKLHALLVVRIGVKSGGN
jgi:class 3 adenylate cyclase